MTALRLFVLNFVLCFIITINWRAIANLRYGFAWFSDVGYFFIQYATIKHVVKSDRFTDQLAYAIGGATGSILAMWLTRTF